MDGAMPFAFLEGALDRAENLRDDDAALTALWPRARILVIDNDGNAATDAGGAPLQLHGDQIGGGPGAGLFLGLRGGQGWFALRAESVSIEIPARIDLRSAAAQWPALEATAFAQARALLHWRARHRYCSACGTTLAFTRSGWLGHCAQCKLEHYPLTDPAVIVEVSDGARLLLGRQANWLPRRYSTLAGFVEPGESLEQTVMREVFEESNVRLRNCRYLASQPWPFPSSLMLGFMAEAEPDTPRVSDELEDARWFTREEVGAAMRGETRDEGLLLSPRLSISRWLIEQWYAQT